MGAWWTWSCEKSFKNLALSRTIRRGFGTHSHWCVILVAVKGWESLWSEGEKSALVRPPLCDRTINQHKLGRVALCQRSSNKDAAQSHVSLVSRWMKSEPAPLQLSKQSGFHGDRADLPVVAKQRRSKLDLDGSGGLNTGAAVRDKSSLKPTKSSLRRS